MSYGVLVALGLSWGLTIPVTKIAVSTGYQPMGLIAWQTLLMSVILTGIMILRRTPFVISRPVLALYVVIALSGTVVPNSFSYRAAAELPAGVMAIIIALVPMFSLPIALALRLERPDLARFAGLILGVVAVVMIVGPDASLPEGTQTIFVAIALIAPFCYGIEGNYLAQFGTRGLDPLQVLWGASVVASIITVPAALATGTWIDLTVPWGLPEAAIPVIAAAHATAYVGYVWLVGRTGAVFAAQVAYVVTAAGVIWSMLLLGEVYSAWIWGAFALMLGGLMLVQPKGKSAEPDTA